MTSEQVAALGPAFTDYLGGFRSCFVTKNTFAHLGTYCRGLISDLPRKSVEPIAIAAGAAPRCLGTRARRRGHPIPPSSKSSRQTLTAAVSTKGRVAL